MTHMLEVLIGRVAALRKQPARIHPTANKIEAALVTACYILRHLLPNRRQAQWKDRRIWKVYTYGTLKVPPCGGLVEAARIHISAKKVDAGCSSLRHPLGPPSLALVLKRGRHSVLVPARLRRPHALQE
jgi:hypothetical protein